VCCDDCNAKFIPSHNATRIYWHADRCKLPADAIPSEPGQCDVCGEALAFKDRKCKSDDRFHCFRCNMSFHRSDRLLAHCSDHVCKKPFVCDECHMAYSRKNRLTEHMEVQHGLVAKSAYACPTCEQKFRHSAPLRVHTRVCIHTTFIFMLIASSCASARAS
jgi:hypothetical protein